MSDSSVLRCPKCRATGLVFESRLLTAQQFQTAIRVPFATALLRSTLTRPVSSKLNTPKLARFASNRLGKTKTFIHVGSRRDFCSPATFSPDAAWMMQQARNAGMWLDDLGVQARFLLHDNDGKFTAQFDDFFNQLFKERRGKVIPTSIQAPDMNAYIEAWIGSCKRECLNLFCCFSLGQLDRICTAYADFYNRFRPHQSKDNTVLDPSILPSATGTVKCEKILGGVLKPYYREAA